MLPWISFIVKNYRFRICFKIIWYWKYENRYISATWLPKCFWHFFSILYVICSQEVFITTQYFYRFIQLYLFFLENKVYIRHQHKILLDSINLKCSETWPKSLILIGLTFNQSEFSLAHFFFKNELHFRYQHTKVHEMIIQKMCDVVRPFLVL